MIISTDAEKERGKKKTKNKSINPETRELPQPDKEHLQKPKANITLRDKMNDSL